MHHKNYLLLIIEGLRGKMVLGIFGLLKMLHILHAVLFRCVQQCALNIFCSSLLHFHLEVICMNEFFKKLKLHSPKQLVLFQLFKKLKSAN